jgi:alkyl hydroperoxide reductase subunit D
VVVRGVVRQRVRSLVAAHENTVRQAGIDREAIFEALKVASIVAGVAAALSTADVLVG